MPSEKKFAHDQPSNTALPNQFVPIFMRRGHFNHRLGLSDDEQGFVDEAGIHYSLVYFGDPVKNKSFLVPVLFQHPLTVPSPIRWHYQLNGLAFDEAEVLDQLALLRQMNREVWDSCRNVDDFHDRRRTGRRALLRPSYAWTDRHAVGQEGGPVTRKSITSLSDADLVAEAAHFSKPT